MALMAVHCQTLEEFNLRHRQLSASDLHLTSGGGWGMGVGVGVTVGSVEVITKMLSGLELCS